ncbi:hypothetical protein EVAR_13590_1 [Eumeta japonica]|uniref:Uncharacterized protein n=1 Tax=Eumeta variegata TaxID=151549 RepID=A0A4C1U906_EUMVA|nr:hypothetical protein EVAR_13590_1 [Eumeta japonica]
MKPEFPMIMTQHVLKVNSDVDIVSSLRTQNKHATEDLDWNKFKACPLQKTCIKFHTKFRILERSDARGIVVDRGRAVPTVDQNRLRLYGATASTRRELIALLKCTRHFIFSLVNIIRTRPTSAHIVGHMGSMYR